MKASILTNQPSPVEDLPDFLDPREPAAADPPAEISKTFTDLGVLASIVEALDQVGITSPFPIQSMAIPIALTGTDMIGQARTGTGKTLAFGIPMLQRTVVPG